MPRTSAGLLPYRLNDGALELLLVHPGGPFWARKDDGAWSIAKGEYVEGEDALAAAIREFEEETGHVPAGTFMPLTPIKQPGGKLVTAWAINDPWDLSGFRSNVFSMEWPRGSGKVREFPEVDRAQWFDASTALSKVLKGQRGFIHELRDRLGA